MFNFRQSSLPAPPGAPSSRVNRGNPRTSICISYLQLSLEYKSPDIRLHPPRLRSLAVIHALHSKEGVLGTFDLQQGALHTGFQDKPQHSGTNGSPDIVHSLYQRSLSRIRRVMGAKAKERCCRGGHLSPITKTAMRAR
jgi:hypothetical protein